MSDFIVSNTWWSFQHQFVRIFHDATKKCLLALHQTAFRFSSVIASASFRNQAWLAPSLDATAA